MVLADRNESTTSGLSRHDRRALDRRADRALAKAKGSCIEANATFDWCVIDETGEVRVVPGEDVPILLAAFGLGPLFPVGERERLNQPFGWLPALICIDGHATLRFIESFLLSKGGAA